MKMQALVSFTVMCGLAAAAAAQDGVFFSWTWVTVEAGTSNVINTSPTSVGPGEGVEFRGSFTFAPMFGTPRTTLYTAGVIEGIARVTMDFNASANHAGMFHAEVGRQPALGAAPFVEADRILGIQLGQVGTAGQPLAYTQNAFPDAIIVRWMPLNYTERLAIFSLVPSTTVNIAAELHLNFGGPQGSGQELYWPYLIDNALVEGGSIQVPVIPSPSGVLGLLAMGGLLIRRRERSA
jgi:hypothetical protein